MVSHLSFFLQQFLLDRIDELKIPFDGRKDRKLAIGFWRILESNVDLSAVGSLLGIAVTHRAPKADTAPFVGKLEFSHGATIAGHVAIARSWGVGQTGTPQSRG